MWKKKKELYMGKAQTKNTQSVILKPTKQRYVHLPNRLNHSILRQQRNPGSNLEKDRIGEALSKIHPHKPEYCNISSHKGHNKSYYNSKQIK